MPLYYAAKVEMPSEAGGGQEVVCKSVPVFGGPSSVACSLAVVTGVPECKEKTLGHRILFLWVVTQHLLRPRCFWGWANASCNPEF